MDADNAQPPNRASVTYPDTPSVNAESHDPVFMVLQMSTDRPETSSVEALLSRLERALIKEFIRTRDYDPLKLSELSDEERVTILTEASVYASARLAEIESRSHFLHEVDDEHPGRIGCAPGRNTAVSD